MNVLDEFEEAFNTFKTCVVLQGVTYLHTGTSNISNMASFLWDLTRYF